MKYIFYVFSLKMFDLDHTSILFDFLVLDLYLHITAIKPFLFFSVLSEPTVDSFTKGIADIISILPFSISFA